MADPATPTPVAPESAPRSVGEDPPGTGDETSNFVLDAFEPMTSDLGEQEYLPEVHQPPVAQEPTAPAVPTTPTAAQPSATPVATPPVEPKAPVVPRPAEPQGAPQQADPAASAPVPAVQPQAAVPTAPVQAPAPSGPAPGDFGAIAEGLRASQAVFTKKLAETEYKLSKEDKEAMGLDDVQAEKFEHFAANVHVNAVGTVLRTVASQMPALMERYLQTKQVAQSNEDKFFGAWPQLKEHKTTVETLARAYRMTQPQATEEQFIKMVGSMAVTALGLQAQAPAAPQVPAVQTPGRVVRPNGTAAFVPARAANAPAGGPAPVQVNPWDMGTQFIASDDAGHFDN